MVKKELRIQELKNARGGKGTLIMKHILEQDELAGHGRLYAEAIFNPGVTLGYHQHVGDFEPYYVIEGEGIFIDAEGNRIPIKAGDLCNINPGEFHGVENTGDGVLRMIALILYEEKK
ncbi:Oxalate-binding protein [bioreactor metagenome]|uniref:Oxalate-binding protein n=1 Tax=bioreactor metagenome TaxID=1076179 RepID=A0A645DXX5_9ZZZZ|nr:cupin domain-containing protein [Lachnospiraceae bacterium]